MLLIKDFILSCLLAPGNLRLSLLCRLFSLWQSLNSGLPWGQFGAPSLCIAHAHCRYLRPSSPVSCHPVPVSLVTHARSVSCAKCICVGGRPSSDGKDRDGDRMLMMGFLGWASHWARVFSSAPDPELHQVLHFFRV